MNRAEAEAKLSLQSSNDPTAPLMQAVIEKQRGNLDHALEYLNRGVERENGHITRSHEGLHLEIENFPTSTNATKLVFDLIKVSPTAHSYVTVSETLKAMGDDRGALYWAYQGLQKYPRDAELRGLSRRLGAATSRVN